jgi:hypothetical protein
MPQSFERHTISFILRLWVESTQDSGQSRWRGQVEHVGSGERVYFEVPAALLDFLAAHLPSEVDMTGANTDSGTGSEKMKGSVP